jgi:predicted CXXCH cytochrome family protein
VFLPGSTTDGHYQIEDDCEACHTPGVGVTQDACIRCHEDELDAGDDSHPPSKFLDPRNADVVALLDARKCVTCHTEHRPAMTGPVGLTRPGDICVVCHDDIAEERPTHEGMEFSTCQNAGCHNFHDNRALVVEHLRAHAGEPATIASARLPARQTSEQCRGQAVADDDPELAWRGSAHATAAVDCTDCHGEDSTWQDDPGHDTCRGCHESQAAGFDDGRHGMRAAAGLSPMKPSLARLPMRDDARDHELGCTSCHGAHTVDTAQAAVDACLGCHADEHTLAYEGSPHHRLWLAEMAGDAPPGSGVSCATCHLPRVETRVGRALTVSVVHDQNDNLRPNEKMIRPVCQRCHGLGFALDALADPALLLNNFRGTPTAHVPSIDMAQQEEETR